VDEQTSQHRAAAGVASPASQPAAALRYAIVELGGFGSAAQAINGAG